MPQSVLKNKNKPENREVNENFGVLSKVPETKLKQVC